MILINYSSDLWIVISDDLRSSRRSVSLSWRFVAIVAFDTFIVFIIVNFFLFFIRWCCSLILVVLAFGSLRCLGSSLFLWSWTIVNSVLDDRIQFTYALLVPPRPLHLLHRPLRRHTLHCLRILLPPFMRSARFEAQIESDNDKSTAATTN